MLSEPQIGLYSIVDGQLCKHDRNCGDAVVAVVGAAVVDETMLLLFPELPWLLLPKFPWLLVDGKKGFPLFPAPGNRCGKNRSEGLWGRAKVLHCSTVNITEKEIDINNARKEKNRLVCGDRFCAIHKTALFHNLQENTSKFFRFQKGKKGYRS